jgi:MerR family transcriptional regulator, light-induced transcriptional regulator
LDRRALRNRVGPAWTGDLALEGDAVAVESREPTPDPSDKSSSDPGVVALVDTLVSALCLDYEERALTVLSEAIASGLEAPDIYLRVFQPALERMGELWEQARACVGEEHRATATVRWLMDALIDDFKPLPEHPHRGTVLAGCVAEEHHDVGLLMVSRFLRRDGWHVVDLGADVPANEFVYMAVRMAPRVCLLSTATDLRLSALSSAIDGLRAAGLATPVVVGGALFRAEPDLATAVKATATAADARAAVTLLRRLAPA